MEILSLTKKQLLSILRMPTVPFPHDYMKILKLCRTITPYLMSKDRPKGFEKFWIKKKSGSSKKKVSKESSSDEEEPEESEKPKKSKRNKKNSDPPELNIDPKMPKFGLFLLLMILLMPIVIRGPRNGNSRTFTQREALDFVKIKSQPKIKVIKGAKSSQIILLDKNGAEFGTLNLEDPDQFIESAKKIKPTTDIIMEEESPVSNPGSFFFFTAFLIAMIILMRFLSRRGLRNNGNVNIKSAFDRTKFDNSSFGINPFSFSNSKAVEYGENNEVNVTFKDVAGMDGAKEEIQEFVSFLKNPKKFSRLGAKIPKGALLAGPPGTGKTLLAKACAGEAKVAFFATSGSEFVEMFVGVGAARVRNLFKKAKEKSPSIVFIDEIDAIGKKRSKMGFNDEREGTLNQIFVEMDGFNTDTNVVVFAATNFKESLDPALIRPGRFDRIIEVNLPTMKEREDIFNVHLKKIKVEKSLDKKIIARKMSALTTGMSGADISSVCNEAAILAARVNKPAVTMDEFYESHDRVLTGLKRKLPLKPYAKKVTAFHESGHTIVGWFLEHARPVLKVSIVPRSKGSLGHTMIMPNEIEFYGKEEIEDLICVMYGGRAAEEVFLESITTGAQSDIQRATDLAKQYVGRFGMTKEFENLTMLDYSSGMGERKMFYSSETAQKFDKLVKEVCVTQYERAKALLRSKKAEMQKLTELLSKKDTVELDELREILGESLHKTNKEIETYLEDLKKMKHNKKESKPEDEKNDNVNEKS